MMSITDKDRRLLNEWTHRSCVQIKQQTKIARYQQPLFENFPPYPEHHAAMDSIMCIHMDALELTIPIQELLSLIKDQDQLRQLMHIPEVREAMFYYRLSGEFDEE
jgi:hypothetical protein